MGAIKSETQATIPSPIFLGQILIPYFAVTILTPTIYRHNFTVFRLNLKIGEGIEAKKKFPFSSPERAKFSSLVHRAR